MSHLDASSPSSIANAASPEDGLAARDSRLSRRTLTIGLTLAALALLVVIVALQFFVADRNPLLSAGRLVAAQQLWQQHGPSSYDMEVEIRGAQPGNVHVEVRDGAVTQESRDGLATPKRTWDTWSVPGMFSTLERELVLAEDPQHEMDVAAGTRLQLRCDFDPKNGLPRRYHRFATGAAPEVFWRVTDFQPK